MPPQTWLIVGATRGIGLEFTSQLLSRGDTVIATARSPTTPLLASPTLPKSPSQSTPGIASKLWSLTGTPNGHNLTVLECDVSDEGCIKAFTEQVRRLGRKGGVLERGVIDVVVMNAGMLDYPNRISEISFAAFAQHLHTNTIGPLITASHLLSLSSPTSATFSASTNPLSPSFSSTPIHIRTLVFISSDSGSTTNFRSFEDGFGAYAASKSALNQGLRHLAAELHRKSKGVPRSALRSPGFRDILNGEVMGERTVVLALHPGEVTTDMASNVSVEWEVEGIISPRESIGCMLRVIGEKGWGGADQGGVASAVAMGRREEEGAATFWTWEGNRYPW